MEAKGSYRLRLLYLAKVLMENTDEAHALEISQINSLLAEYGITANRKTLYMDFEDLRSFGLDIVSGKLKDNRVLYHIGQRRFELPELKLLVDSVQSAKFLSVRKSNDLIKKIESLGSKYEAKHLQRQVFISGRVKSVNEKIYYNVDLLHEAINANKQIRFLYYQWNVKK